MYHRYIPAAGGGYLCRTIQEPPRRRPEPPEAEPPRQDRGPCRGRDCGSQQRGPSRCAPPPEPESRRGPDGSLHGLLERLLPEDLELDDVLILLILLLLMLDSCDGDTLTVLIAAAAFLMLQ